MSASRSTRDKLYGMRMSVMAQAYRDQEGMHGIADRSFDERFAMIVGAEWDLRCIDKRARLLRQAAFSDAEANVIDIRYDIDRKLDKARIAELASCKWVKAHGNVVIAGASARASRGSPALWASRPATCSARCATRACWRCSKSSPCPKTRNGSNRRSAARSATCR